MLVTAGLAVAGLVLLAFGADHLVIGAGRIAERLRVTPVIVGVVVIGLGTSAPEFVVSGVAAARGEVGLAMGNLVGSNIINVTLVLGTAALIAPIVIHSSVPVREAPLAVLATAVFGALALWRLGRVAGVVLAALLVLALLLLVHLAGGRDGSGGAAPAGGRTPGPSGGHPAPPHRLPRESLRALAGLAATLAGAQFLVVNAAELAERLGAPPALIGFTLVAFGTSLPELVTAVQAQRRGDADLLVGNVLGSNLFNSLAGGAVVGLVAPSTARAALGYPIVAVMVGVGALAWLALARGRRVTRLEGAVLLGVYAFALPLMT